MNIDAYKIALSENVIDSMLFMLGDDEDSCFSKEDIAKCEKLILEYLESLAALTEPTDEKIMACVEKLVLALNELSEETDYAMIETVEREAIWEIIQNSAIECGLKEYSDDITEEWREW